ncbi:MAG TPA: hypothetical protein VJU85_01180 [Nitrososphaeraceae archaeon]|nr:hypothetical protein [Nitrososphaeraceae archaeon]
MNNIEETILVGIFIRLSTDAIIRVIDYGSEIKEKLLTSFLMKFNKKSKRKQDPNTLFNLNTRIVLNDNNEYVFR